MPVTKRLCLNVLFQVSKRSQCMDRWPAVYVGWRPSYHSCIGAWKSESQWLLSFLHMVQSDRCEYCFLHHHRLMWGICDPFSRTVVGKGSCWLPSAPANAAFPIGLGLIYSLDTWLEAVQAYSSDLLTPLHVCECHVLVLPPREFISDTCLLTGYRSQLRSLSYNQS